MGLSCSICICASLSKKIMSQMSWMMCWSFWVNGPGQCFIQYDSKVMDDDVVIIGQSSCLMHLSLRLNRCHLEVI